MARYYRERRKTLWEVGRMRCVLIALKNPTLYAVHVFDGDSPICMEHCQSGDEAAAVAEEFRVALNALP